MGINPYIAFQGNCREAVEFYKQALGAKVLFSQTFGESPMRDAAPADKIMHCSIQAGNSTIMMCDDPRPGSQPAGGNISLAIGLNDAEQAKQVFANLSDGGAVIMPLEKTFWADAFGMLTDRFGVKWMINCETRK
ncbi:MAG: VOC family protein [Bryobacterales bacterium]|nr:VOC family protein [Bryobacterales bacterium]